jgi:hypothetical protein
MKERGLRLVIIFLLCWAVAGLALAQEIDWDKAALGIKRLSPDAFPAAPEPVRTALIRMGCTIPQYANAKQPHNLTTGSFAKPGQTDWAALCSRNGESSIIVFWGGSPTSTTILGQPTKDKEWLQGEADGTALYSHSIGSASIKTIKKYVARYGAVDIDGKNAPPITHDGIEDGSEKGSTIYYYHGGKWVELMGGD